jgi:hypothetical protein
MPIKGSTLFTGQYIFNSTAGAPLSASTTNGLASGVSNTEVNSTTAATTTSTTDVLMTGMTITPVAGTYLVFFSCWVTNTVGLSNVVISIYVGATQKADSLRQCEPGSSGLTSGSQNMCLATNGVVTVNGSQAITIQWHVQSGTGTVTNRTLNILRVA